MVSRRTIRATLTVTRRAADSLRALSGGVVGIHPKLSLIPWKAYADNTVTSRSKKVARPKNTGGLGNAMQFATEAAC